MYTYLRIHGDKLIQRSISIHHSDHPVVFHQYFRPPPPFLFTSIPILSRYIRARPSSNSIDFNPSCTSNQTSQTPLVRISRPLRALETHRSNIPTLLEFETIKTRYIHRAISNMNSKAFTIQMNQTDGVVTAERRPY